ncbi:MAG: hypothetical protein JWM02_648 [Frankiales bacterium]|nr:hypothetical protein [Frankiales bacterium]
MELVPPDARLTGRWQRSLLTTTDGHRDSSTNVTWLQAHGLYVDLRQPVPGPDLPPLGCLRDLTRDQAVALAGTEGFAGRLVADGDWAHWERLVDLQPPGPTLDEGRLVPDGDDVVEHGRDGSYVEYWQRTTGPTTPVAALLLRERTTGATAVLVRVGEDVAWARGRTQPLDAGALLAERVAAADSVQDAQDLLDTEVAMGRVGPDGIVLTRSSLPWRAGSLLDAAAAGEDLSTWDVTPEGTAVQRRWQVLAREGELADLLAHSRLERSA